MHENSLIKQPNSSKAQIEIILVPKHCKADFNRQFYHKNMDRYMLYRIANTRLDFWRGFVYFIIDFSGISRHVKNPSH